MFFLRFDSTYIFYYFCITIPLLILFWVLFISRYRREAKSLALNYIISKRLLLLRAVFALLSILSFTIAFFWPVLNIDLWNGFSWSKNIIFVVDLSKSMDAKDVSISSKSYSRLDAAKLMMSEFVQKFPNYNYWIIWFSDSVLMISPLTQDSDRIYSYIDGLDSSFFSKWWTNFPELSKYIESSDDSKVSKNYVILSDWEDLSWQDAPKFNNKRIINSKIFTIWLWSTSGSNIPDWSDFFGNTMYKNYEWKRVVTRLDESSLESIAKAWNWSYIFWKSLSSVVLLENRMLASDGRKFEKISKSQDAWYYFSVASLLFLLCAYLINHRKNAS